MVLVRRRLAVLILGLTLGADLLAGQQVGVPDAVPLSTAILAKLPQDWRDLARHVKASDQEQQRFMKLSDVVLRQTIARILIRSRAADGFLKGQLTKESSPAVRITIVQAIAGDSRWRGMSDTTAVLEGLLARDPDPSVSLAALEALRRLRMRELTGLLNERISMTAGRGRPRARRP